MSPELVVEISKWLILATFLATAVFCLAYHLMSNWRHTQFGVTLMVHQLAMTGVLGSSVLTAFAGPHMWVTYFGLLMLGVVPVALMGRLWVLIKAKERLDQNE